MVQQSSHHRAGEEAKEGNAEGSGRRHVTHFDTPEAANASLDRYVRARRKSIDTSLHRSLFSSFRDMITSRMADRNNEMVSGWASEVNTADQTLLDLGPPTPPNGEVFVGVSDAEPPMGHETQNKPVVGRTYFIDDDLSRLEPLDLRLMRETGPWSDAPSVLGISQDIDGPGTSRTAIEKFERQCHDLNSVVSRAATWGTVRRSSSPDPMASVDVASGLVLRNILGPSHIHSQLDRDLANLDLLFEPSSVAGLRALERRPTPLATYVALDFPDSHAGLKYTDLIKPVNIADIPPRKASLAHTARDTSDTVYSSNAMTVLGELDTFDPIWSPKFESAPVAQASEPAATEIRQLTQVLPATAPRVTEPIPEEPSQDMITPSAHDSAVPLDVASPEQRVVGSSNAGVDRGVETGRQVHPPKQVGVARIRIELLSISRSDATGDPGTSGSLSEAEPDETADGGDDRGTAESVCDAEPSEGVNNATHEAAGGQYRDLGTSRRNQGESGQSENGNDEPEDPGRKRRRLKSPEPVRLRPRLACPYQAYEASQLCFQPGLRNEAGGCDGICRLRYLCPPPDSRPQAWY